MVKNRILSANKANSLFWLGRYEERVYITLHLMRKCYDKMIDGTGPSGRNSTRRAYIRPMMSLRLA